MLRNTLVMRATFALVLASLAATALCDLTSVRRDQSTKTGQVVVKGLDFKKYCGRWYEIAKYPSPIEIQDAENTRANYSLRADGNGRFDIIYETFPKGRNISIRGIAYRAERESDEAKLIVLFDRISYYYGTYWVLYVDDEYQYAVVGHPYRAHLYILSRKNKIDEQVYNQLLQKAKEQGYDLQKLIKTTQTDPSPP